MNWQPIETAPKDGRTLLLYTYYGNIEICCWSDGQWYLRDSSLWEPTIVTRPTHWMPLPEPPNE